MQRYRIYSLTSRAALYGHYDRSQTLLFEHCVTRSLTATESVLDRLDAEGRWSESWADVEA